MKEKNDKLLITKAEWGPRAWPTLLYPTHPSHTHSDETWKRLVDVMEGKKLSGQENEDDSLMKEKMEHKDI